MNTPTSDPAEHYSELFSKGGSPVKGGSPSVEDVFPILMQKINCTIEFATWELEVELKKWSDGLWSVDASHSADCPWDLNMRREYEQVLVGADITLNDITDAVEREIEAEADYHEGLLNDR